MSVQDTWIVRDHRFAEHGREGFRLAIATPDYEATVLRRLAPDLERTPTDLWSAIPWVWALCLGAPKPDRGAMAIAAHDAAAVLRAWFSGEEPYEDLDRRWNEALGSKLSLGSTLRSHPFPDLRSWFILPTSAA